MPHPRQFNPADATIERMVKVIVAALEEKGAFEFRDFLAAEPPLTAGEVISYMTDACAIASDRLGFPIERIDLSAAKLALHAEADETTPALPERATASSRAPNIIATDPAFESAVVRTFVSGTFGSSPIAIKMAEIYANIDHDTFVITADALVDLFLSAGLSPYEIDREIGPAAALLWSHQIITSDGCDRIMSSVKAEIGQVRARRTVHTAPIPIQSARPEAPKAPIPLIICLTNGAIYDFDLDAIALDSTGGTPHEMVARDVHLRAIPWLHGRMTHHVPADLLGPIDGREWLRTTIAVKRIMWIADREIAKRVAPPEAASEMIRDLPKTRAPRTSDMSDVVAATFAGSGA